MLILKLYIINQMGIEGKGMGDLFLLSFFLQLHLSTDKQDTFYIKWELKFGYRPVKIDAPFPENGAPLKHFLLQFCFELFGALGFFFVKPTPVGGPGNSLSNWS